jgi:hypothetical protein
MRLTWDLAGDRIELEPEALVIAGFTGRDRESVEAHLHELRALGVPTPDSVPAFYPAPGSLASQADRLTAVHADTSGEAEAVLIFDADDVYLTLGSDHTDRAAESADIALSKLVCPKLVAASAWPLREVETHLDDLELTSWIVEDGDEVVYQRGLLGELMDLRELVAEVPFSRRPTCFLMFTGTLAAIGGIRASTRFRARLDDPSLGRSIDLRYEIEVLDVLSGDGEA